MSKASLELGGDNWAAKDGNLLGYAVGDSSGKYVPREFTFTRGSNLAATRVAANGLIEKGRENFLNYSNDFSQWATSGANETSGQNGYDGSSNAWLLTKNVSDGYIYQNISQSGVQCVSVYAKANAIGGIQIYVNAGTTREQSFNLTNGTVIGSGNNIDAKIESVGNGWYRCSMALSDAITRVRFYPMTSAGDKTGTSGSIYIQDAQLEQGLVATDYIETGASTVQAGLLEDEPRIDYTGGTGSLLLEPSRTNVIKQSEYINGWNFLLNVNVTDNAAISPEGVLNASNIVPTTAASSQKVLDISGFNRTSGQYTSHTIYAKANGYNYLYLSNAADRLFAVYDLSDGSVDYVSSNGTDFINHSASIESVGNGWYRCALIGEAVTSIGSYLRISVAPTSETISAPAYTADGTSGVLVYGVQVEQASYPTSYIPNHSGGSVTRDADDLNDLDVSSMLTSSSFTWFLDLNDYIGSDINSQNIWLESTSSSIEIQFRVRPDGYRFYYNNIAGGSAYPIAGSKTANKFCVSYDGSNYRLYIDGILEATTASVGDSGWDFIKNATGASLPLKQMLLFPTALSDAQCSALTVEGLKEEILTSYIAAVDTLEDGAEARLDTYLQNLEELIV